MSNTKNEAQVVLSTEVVETHYAEILINGQSKGKRPINGTPSLREFSTSLAKEFGVNAFNVTVDGSPITSNTQANSPVAPGSTIGVSAKDSRAARSSRPSLALTFTTD